MNGAHMNVPISSSNSAVSSYAGHRRSYALGKARTEQTRVSIFELALGWDLPLRAGEVDAVSIEGSRAVNG